MFKEFSNAVHARYEKMQKEELYVVDVLDIFSSYLRAFDRIPGSNPIYRERTEHDCNCCKNFIRRLGHVVTLADDGTRQTVWDDYQNLPEPYKTVSKVMSDLIQQAPIQTVFRSKERSYGAIRTTDNLEAKFWDHFYGTVANRHYDPQADTVRSKIESTVHVFKRGMNEVTVEAIELAIDLGENNSVYRLKDQVQSLKNYLALKKAYDASFERSSFIWANYDKPAARAKNSSLGEFLTNLSKGVELEVAIGKYEAMVAPENYKRTTAPITQKMIEQAVKTLDDLGLSSAVHRRMANIADVSVNDVLFVNNSVRPAMKDGLTELLMTSVKSKPVDIKTARGCSIDEFVKDVVPGADSIKVYVENKHVRNFMTVTGADGDEQLFKWPNNFAWSYDGEIADAATIKERVRKAGGNVEAKLRVSLSWHNSDDLDIHAVAPEGHIYYSQKHGVLDVDTNGLDKQNHVDPVENLAWKKPKNGHYKIYVNQYSARSHNISQPGFELEFSFDGESKIWGHAAPHKMGNIDAFEFDYDNGEIKNFKVGSKLVQLSGSQEKWGVSTESLVEVDTLITSPNYWEGQAVGNCHWFFILKDCKNPDSVRGIYNEFLRPEFEPHRKVFEVLASKTKCPSTQDQLSGVGFSSGRGDKVKVIVDKGGSQKAYEIVF